MMKEDKQLLLELSGAAASSAAAGVPAPDGFMTEDEKRRMRRNALIRMAAMA